MDVYIYIVLYTIPFIGKHPPTPYHLPKKGAKMAPKKTRAAKKQQLFWIDERIISRLRLESFKRDIPMGSLVELALIEYLKMSAIRPIKNDSPFPM